LRQIVDDDKVLSTSTINHHLHKQGLIIASTRFIALVLFRLSKNSIPLRDVLIQTDIGSKFIKPVFAKKSIFETEKILLVYFE